jgi:hypothetical protein
MKWPRLHLSAHQTAALSIAGALLVVGSVLSPWHPHGTPLQFGVLLIPVLGGTIWIMALSRLKSGIKNAVWSETQIESLRTITESPLLTGLGIAFLGVFLFAAFPLMPHSANPALREIGWTSFLLGQCCSQLRFSTQRPRNTTPTTRIDWRSRPPLQSDHWGQR